MIRALCNLGSAAAIAAVIAQQWISAGLRCDCRPAAATEVSKPFIEKISTNEFVLRRSRWPKESSRCGNSLELEPQFPRITPTAPPRIGVLIRGMPAGLADAGLREGDIVNAVNGHPPGLHVFWEVGGSRIVALDVEREGRALQLRYFIEP